MRRFVAVCCLVAGVYGCASVENPVSGKRELTVMDERAEIAEGEKAHKEILAEYGAYDDPALQAYVNQIGQRLAKQSHRSGLQWHFTVLDSPEVNAFALPGGYVYVTRGIMAYMESEADLAGVIAHEIGHVTARHGAQRSTRQQAAGLGVFAATVLGAVLEGKGVTGAGDMAAQVSQGVAAGYVASYSRAQELQADQLSAEYLARVDYDPKNMIDALTVLRDQERFAADQARKRGLEAPEHPSWLASHPSNEQRLEHISELAAKHATAGKYQDEGRGRYLKAIDGLLFGESEAQGLTRGDNFYHPGLGIALTAPRGWRIRNSADSVAVVNEREDAALFVRLVPPNAGADHAAVLRNVVNPEQGQTERLDINGMPATRFVGTRRTPQGQLATVDVTVVTGPEKRHYLLVPGAKSPQARQQAGTELRQAMFSLRPMTAADRAAARPWALKTVPFPAGGFAQLAAGSPLGSDAERHLRLLNGVYVSGTPQVGQPVKVVVAKSR